MKCAPRRASRACSRSRGATEFSSNIDALAGTIGYNPLFVCLMLFDVAGAIVAWHLTPDQRKADAAGSPPSAGFRRFTK